MSKMWRIFKMNDFTKEELNFLTDGLNLIVYSCKINPPELREEFIKLGNKVQAMIDNYCEHEETENVGGWVSICKKCGMEFGDETQ